MKALIVALILASSLFAQAVRFDSASYTTSGQVPSGAFAPVLAVPGATISACQDSACATRATTYTTASAGTPCGALAQLTAAAGGTTCTSLTDGQGNFGFWILPGAYYYRITLPAGAGGGSYIYPISVGASAGCPLGTTCDASYATLALGCTAAGSGTLYVTRAWNSTPTQTLACQLQFLGNGKIQPGSGATVTITGTITASLSQIFDASLGTVALSSQGASPAYPQWFGSTGNGVSDDTASIQSAVSAVLAVNGVLQFPCGNYLTSATITITSRITIEGGGDGTTGTSLACATITATGAVPGVYIESGADYTILRGFALASTAVSGTADGIVVGGVDNTNGAGEVRIQDVTVSSFKGNGVNVRNGNSGILDHVTAQSNGGHGVLISNQQTSVNNTNSWRVLNSSAFSNGGSGFYFNVASATTASGLDTEGNGTYGVYANQPGIRIDGNDSENNTTDDIVTGSSCFGCIIHMNNVNNHIVQGSPYSYITNDAEGNAPYTWPASGVLGVFGGFKCPVVAPTYGVDVTINNDAGCQFLLSVTDSVNFIVLAPSNLNFPQQITVTVANGSGGAMGTLSWSGYVLGSKWVNPLNGCSRSITFEITSGTATEVSRSLSDVCSASLKSDYEYSNTAPLVLSALTASGSTSAFSYPNIAVSSVWRTTCHSFTTTAGSAGSATLALQPDSTVRTILSATALDLTTLASERVVSTIAIIPASTSGAYIGVQYIVSANSGGVFKVECVTERIQ